MKIKRETLELILEVSKSCYPNEFAGFLRVERGVITELVLIPGTISGGTSAVYSLHMLPFDLTIRGTVHSHPTNSCIPSMEDLTLFSKFGGVHIIVAKPFTINSWKAYNSRGEEIVVECI